MGPDIWSWLRCDLRPYSRRPHRPANPSLRLPNHERVVAVLTGHLLKDIRPAAMANLDADREIIIDPRVEEIEGQA